MRITSGDSLIEAAVRRKRDEYRKAFYPQLKPRFSQCPLLRGDGCVTSHRKLLLPKLHDTWLQKPDAEIWQCQRNAESYFQHKISLLFIAAEFCVVLSSLDASDTSYSSPRHRDVWSVINSCHGRDYSCKVCKYLLAQREHLLKQLTRKQPLPDHFERPPHWLW